MKRLHLVLTGISVVIMLLSINRLTTLTTGYLQPHEYLRWLDFNAMLVIPLISVLLYFLLEHDIIMATDRPATSTVHVLLSMVLISGMFFFAAGSGDHEVTNYLHSRFCSDAADTPICRIIAYNDDVFSHIVYYIGFVLINLSLMVREFLLPRAVPARTRDLALIALNALFIALGIFANLAFEPAGLDLVFFGSVTIVSLALTFLRRLRQIPVLWYFSVSYAAGTGATVLYKVLAGA